MIGEAGVNNAGEPPFEIRGFSLGNLIVGAGVLVTALSFADLAFFPIVNCCVPI